eukprot:scaffold470_cov257-Pinguiococcus_pyrenoidosus.AAC.6
MALAQPWHAIHSAVGKLYVYHFTIARVRSPFSRRHRAHFYRLRHADMELFERYPAADNIKILERKHLKYQDASPMSLFPARPGV